MNCRVERAQLVLVGAVVLGVTMVGIALLLNAAIFTENLSTRQQTDGGEAVELQRSVDRAATETVRQLNADNAENRSHDQLAADMAARMADWDGAVRMEYARDGRVSAVGGLSTRQGWRILQTNPGRNFTAGGTDGLAGATDWTLAEDVPATATFEQNLSRTSLYGATFGTTEAVLANSSYHVAVTEPGTSGVWRIYVFEGVGTQQVYLLVEEPDQEFHGNTGAHVEWATEACAYRTVEWVEVDIRGGTMGGAPCDELSFFDDLSPGYSIHYNNTATTVAGTPVNRSQGTYELFVADAAVDGAPYYPASADASPFRLTALYDATFDVTYLSGSVRYRSERRATPDRSSAATNGRPTASFALADGGTEFTADWSATDETALDSVELRLYENATATLIDAATPAVSGDDASGTTTLGPTSAGVRYDVYLIVTDDEGATTVAKRTAVAG